MPGSNDEGSEVIVPLAGSNATEAVNNLELVVIPTDLTPGAELENYVASDLSSEEGVKFRSPYDDTECMLTPEHSIEIQVGDSMGSKLQGWHKRVWSPLIRWTFIEYLGTNLPIS